MRLPEDRDFESSVICPWCGNDCGTDEMYEAQLLDCDECGKQFHMEPNYEVTYCTTVALPDPESQFVECAECGKRFEKHQLTHGKIPYHFPGKSEDKVCDGSHEAPKAI